MFQGRTVPVVGTRTARRDASGHRRAYSCHPHCSHLTAMSGSALSTEPPILYSKAEFIETVSWVDPQFQ